MRYLIRKCLKLRRLGLRRFVNLTDSLVGDIVSNMIRLDYLDLSTYGVMKASVVP